MLSPRYRCAIAAVVLVVDVLEVWLIDTIATDSTHADVRAMARAYTVSSLVGGLCLVAVIVLSWPQRSTGSPTSSRASMAARVVLGVAWLKLVAVAVALPVLGALADLNGLQLFVLAVVESAAVVWLAAGTRRGLVHRRY